MFDKIILKKKSASTIALLLLLAISTFAAALPIANAHTPAWTIPTYAYLAVSPNPIGVGQNAILGNVA